jgi:hypothetical protein
MSFIKALTDRLATGQKAPAIRYADFSTPPSDDVMPRLDRSTLDTSTLTPEQVEWRRDGVLILRDFIPDEMTEPYIKRREAYERPGGWVEGHSYQFVPEMRQLALYPPLMEKLKLLIGEEMMLHLCLTNWVTS